MIKFPCKCGFEFEVANDKAGDPIQCPRCMLLNQVPLLSDINTLEEDGTIRLEPFAIEEEGAREAELRRTYLPRRHDDAGNDIDMRNTAQEMIEAGADEIPLELKDHLRPGAPKYDPDTGELIKPLTVRGDDAQPVIPIAVGPPKLHYQKNYSTPAAAIWKAPMLLFTPASAVVLIGMFSAQLFAFVIWILIGGGLVWAFFIPLCIYMLTLAHLANVVEDTGPHEKDELPTPLRGLSWSEDIWQPFWRFCVAFALCYAPALVVFFSDTMRLKFGPVATLGFSGGLAVAGSFFFPAVLLIAITSGTYINLRPDRVLGTIGTIGGKYLFVFILWCLAAWSFTAGTVGSILYALSMIGIYQIPRIPAHIGISVGLIAVGTYLLHMFGWVLGGLYRSCHEDFPWAYQKHISTRKVERRLVRPRGQPIPVQPVDTDPGILAPDPPPPRLRTKPIANPPSAFPSPPYSGERAG